MRYCKIKSILDQYVDDSLEVFHKLELYKNLVSYCNQQVNLISRNDINAFWEKHIMDSLQLFKYINDTNTTLVDVGSGAGLPGVVLSISGIKNVILIESNKKKAMFLHKASLISKNKVKILNERAEKLNFTCDILTSRALSKLSSIFKITKDIRVNNKILLFTNNNYEKELHIIRKKWNFKFKEHSNEFKPNSRILEFVNLVSIN